MKTLSFPRRLFWMLVVLAIQAIYFPTSQAASGGIAPKLPIDIFPVIPIWVVPYYLTYLFWIFAIYWTLFRLDDRSVRAALAGALFTVSVGAAAFVFFPTYIDLPAVTGTDIFSNLLRMVQVAGGTHAALPSAHNYLTMLSAAFAVRLYSKWRWLWISIVVTVALSTLFTGQHYILHVVTGLTLGWIGYQFGWLFLERSEHGLAAHHSS